VANSRDLCTQLPTRFWGGAALQAGVPVPSVPGSTTPAGGPTAGGGVDLRAHGAGVLDACALKADGLGAALEAGFVEVDAARESRSGEPRAFGKRDALEGDVAAEAGAGEVLIGVKPDLGIEGSRTRTRR